MESSEGSQAATMPGNRLEPVDARADHNLFRLLLDIESRFRKEGRNESGITVAKQRIFGSQNDRTDIRPWSSQAANLASFPSEIPPFQNGQ